MKKRYCDILFLFLLTFLPFITSKTKLPPGTSFDEAIKEIQSQTLNKLLLPSKIVIINSNILNKPESSQKQKLRRITKPQMTNIQNPSNSILTLFNNIPYLSIDIFENLFFNRILGCYIDLRSVLQRQNITFRLQKPNLRRQFAPQIILKLQKGKDNFISSNNDNYISKENTTNVLLSKALMNKVTKFRKESSRNLSTRRLSQEESNSDDEHHYHHHEHLHWVEHSHVIAGGGGGFYGGFPGAYGPGYGGGYWDDWAHDHFHHHHH